MLVLEQTEDRVRLSRYNVSSLFRNVFHVDRDTRSRLYNAVTLSWAHDELMVGEHLLAHHLLLRLADALLVLCA